MNSWSPGLDGPPHAHEAKEQNFLVTAGRGEVVIGAERFPAAPGDFFYVPAGVVHQTINLDKDQRLDYFLFNAFLDAGKEGHASFADHINKVKHVRRQQADSQQSGVRSESARCEAMAWHLAAGTTDTIATDSSKEQTLFVYSGTGTIQVGSERVTVQARHTLLVPRGTSCALAAGPSGLLVVSFGTMVKR
jgi:mannose-6-phosphate isomerase-like protein (cupin superfamily)